MNKTFVFLSLMIALLFSSCASRKDFVYLSDMQMGEKYPFDPNHEVVVQSGDRLGITVSCKNPELAIPFNIQGGNFQIDRNGNVNPEKPDVPLNKNDAFQKVQKRHVQEKR